MAYSFTAASSQYLSASAPLTAIPATLTSWSKMPNSGTALQTSLYVGVASATNRIAIYKNYQSSPTRYVRSAQHVGQSAGPVADAGATEDNVWHSSSGVFSSATSRVCYLNDTAGTAVTTNAGSSSSYDILIIGARYNTTLGNYSNGSLAEAAVWSVALTADEIASLAKGFKPTRIRPQSLVFYAPLIRDLKDWRGGLTITNNNTATVADHPRVY